MSINIVMQIFTDWSVSYRIGFHKFENRGAWVIKAKYEFL